METYDLIVKSNLLNWILLIGVLIWGWTKYTPPLFEARRKRIESTLNDAKAAREQGEQHLAKQQQDIANAEKTIAGMIEEARKFAAEQEAQAKQQTAKDLVDLQKKIESQIQSERQLAITELRSAAARAAIKLTEQALPKLIDKGDAKSKLLSQFMEQLDSANQQAPMTPPGKLESIH